MSINPKTISKDGRITSPSELMNSSKVNSLLVVDNSNNLVCIVQIYDLGI